MSLNSYKPISIGNGGIVGLDWHYFTPSTESSEKSERQEMQSDYTLRRQLEKFAVENKLLKEQQQLNEQRLANLSNSSPIINVSNLSPPMPITLPPMSTAYTTNAPNTPRPVATMAAVNNVSKPILERPVAPQVSAQSIKQGPVKITSSYLNTLTNSNAPTTHVQPQTYQQYPPIHYRSQQPHTAHPVHAQHYKSQQISHKKPRKVIEHKSQQESELESEKTKSGKNFNMILKIFLEQDWKKILKEVGKYCHD